MVPKKMVYKLNMMNKTQSYIVLYESVFSRFLRSCSVHEAKTDEDKQKVQDEAKTDEDKQKVQDELKTFVKEK